MSLKLTYYGQNDSVNCTPAVPLTGDPGTDQATLTAAGYLGGVIVALINSSNVPTGYTFQAANEPAFGSIGNIVPCDCDLTVVGSPADNATSRPFATLLNGPGEFSGAIGPSGSRKAPVVRALWQGNVDFQGYDANASFTIGEYVYCGGSVHNNKGLYTDNSLKGTGSPAVGICTHVPSATEPWLGVASLL
jgi:hypothetical protein